MNTLRAGRGDDRGFTLVELLVVIIIIGILAAIAIPLYLEQNRRANDAAAESDAKNLGTLVRAAYDENGAVTSVSRVGDNYLIDGEVAMGASPGVEFVSWTSGTIETWCFDLRHPHGEKSKDPAVRFDAQNGYVEQASCP